MKRPSLDVTKEACDVKYFPDERLILAIKKRGSSNERKTEEMKRTSIQLFFLCFFSSALVTALPAFQDYGAPDPNGVAKIDLDQRSIIARTALANEKGLTKAEIAYKFGVDFNSTTLKTIVTDDNVYRDFSLYNAYVSFFGDDALYPDTWIQAAFDNSNLKLGEKNVYFRKLNEEGRSAAVRWGTLVLNVFIKVTSCLNEALELCSDSADASQTHWDQAFAFYTGSLAEAEHPLGGYLLYNFAQLQCDNFGTCAKGDEAPSNTKILKAFVDGKDHIAKNHCNRLQDEVTQIQAQMTVPLVQATLKVAYAMDLEDDMRQETQGEAAAFSAAMAPLVSMCNEGLAYTIFRHLSPGNRPETSYEVVKDALQRSYDCLNITCAHVGGLISLNGEYVHRGEACDNVQPVAGAGGYKGYDRDSPSPSPDKSKNLSSPGTNSVVYVGITMGILASFLLGILVGRRCQNNSCKIPRRNEKEYDASSSDTPVSECEQSTIPKEITEAFEDVTEPKRQDAEII